MPRKGLWHPAHEEQLSVLWMQANPALSARQIGEKMGMSKNQIIGKARRLGLPFKRTESVRGKMSRARTGAPNKQVVVLPKMAALSKAKKPVDLTPQSVPGGLHILELKDHHCRNIIGEGPDGLARYCGAQVAMRPKLFKGQPVIGHDGRPEERALSWCEAHAYVNFQPSKR